MHYSFFCLGVLLGLCFILATETESFRWILLHFSLFYIEKYKVVAFFAYGFEEVLALEYLDESFI